MDDQSKSSAHKIIREGTFYTITNEAGRTVLHDRTKRGLEIKEHSMDEEAGVMADKGMIHDMDGIGHMVPIRWYYDKAGRDPADVIRHADDIEHRYTKLREITCPDD